MRPDPDTNAGGEAAAPTTATSIGETTQPGTEADGEGAPQPDATAELTETTPVREAPAPATVAPPRGFTIPPLTDPRELAAAIRTNVNANHDAGTLDDENYETFIAIAAAIDGLVIDAGITASALRASDAVESAIVRRLETLEQAAATKPPSVAADANLLDAGDIDGAASLLVAGVKELGQLREAGAIPARTAAVLENMMFAIAALGGVDLKATS